VIKLFLHFIWNLILKIKIVCFFFGIYWLEKPWEATRFVGSQELIWSVIEAG
jgi:hypothetical protein